MKQKVQKYTIAISVCVCANGDGDVLDTIQKKYNLHPTGSSGYCLLTGETDRSFSLSVQSDALLKRKALYIAKYIQKIGRGSIYVYKPRHVDATHVWNISKRSIKYKTLQP